VSKTRSSHRPGHTHGSARRADLAARLFLPARGQPLARLERRHLAQGTVRAMHVVMVGVFGQHRLHCRPPTMSNRSSTSRRTVPTHRSAEAFARGARTGVRSTSIASPAKTASNAAVNFISRSRIKNRTQPRSSPDSMSRFRACWATRSPTGREVTRAHGPGGPPPRSQTVKRAAWGVDAGLRGSWQEADRSHSGREIHDADRLVAADTKRSSLVPVA
jgi:hypothetical protein